MKVSYLICIICLNLLIACGNSGDGDPCYSPPLPPCAAKILDSVYLDTTKNLAPLFVTEKTDTFYNIIANAKQFYLVSSSMYSFSKIHLKETRRYPKCGYSDVCYDYGKTQSRIISYTHNLTNKLNIIVRWEKQYFPMVNSPVEPNLVAFKNLSDRFTIQFGAYASNLLIPDFFYFGSNSSQTFHDKMDINGNLVDSVFEFTRTVDPNSIDPQGVYYSKKLGIVGFYLTDKKEVWLKIF